MRVQTVRDVGSAVRRAREAAGTSQAELAATVGLSRRWLSALEAGKPAIDLGLVLRALDGVGLRLEVSPTDPAAAPQLAAASTGVDLDELLDAYRTGS